MPYAVIHLGYSIFGVGETKKEALADAELELGPDEIVMELMPLDDRIIGRVVLVECTAGLKRAFEEKIDWARFDINDLGIAYEE